MDNKKLIALLVGSGVALGFSGSLQANLLEEETLNSSPVLINDLVEDVDFHNGCCGGSTCNGSC